MLVNNFCNNCLLETFDLIARDFVGIYFGSDFWEDLNIQKYLENDLILILIIIHCARKFYN